MANRMRERLLRLATCLGFVLMAGLPAGLAPPAHADALDQLDNADRAAIRQAIEGQIDAFLADDAERAFSFATPMIQNRFGDAATFVRMVQQGYRPVYRPRSFEFTDLVDLRGQPAQQALLTGPENGVFNAWYMMEQLPGGEWRISGCILRPLGDQSI